MQGKGKMVGEEMKKLKIKNEKKRHLPLFQSCYRIKIF